MIRQLKKGEIVHCNLLVQYRKREVWIKDVVYKDEDGIYHRLKNLARYKIKESVPVKAVDVISHIGFDVFTEQYAGDKA